MHSLAWRQGASRAVFPPSPYLIGEWKGDRKRAFCRLPGLAETPRSLISLQG